MLLLVTYHAPHALPPAPSSGVVTWSRPGPNLLVQSEFFSGMNTWTIGGRCYHLPQELLSCSFLWPRSLSCGDNLNKVEKTSRSSKQSQDWQRWELQQEKKKASAGSTLLFLSLRPYFLLSVPSLVSVGYPRSLPMHPISGWWAFVIHNQKRPGPQLQATAMRHVADS